MFAVQTRAHKITLTSEELSEKNPVFPAGHVVLVSDQESAITVGDGVTPYLDLPFLIYPMAPSGGR